MLTVINLFYSSTCILQQSDNIEHWEVRHLKSYTWRMALLKIAIAVIFCFHVLQLSNAKAAGPGALNKTGVLQLSNATKAAGLGSLNRTGVLLNSSTEEHLRKTRTAG